MPTKQATVDFILDQLSILYNSRAIKMFGEYALYCDEKVVALICDDRLFVKMTEAGAKLIKGRFEEAPAYPGAKASLLVNEDVLDDRELFTSLIRKTADALPLPKPKHRRIAK